MFVTSSQERRQRALRDALAGQVLPGSDGALYPLRERIGEGSQGWVFRATWNGSVDVVVKVLRPEAASADSLARFQREAQVLRMLSQQQRPNPHVVRFYDHAYATVSVEETNDTWTLPFTVLEYVDGATLERVLQRAGNAGLGLERARRVLRHVSLAIRDVHAQNVVHRDLKPSNILIAASGTREIAKVTDFGLAKLMAGTGHRTSFAGATVGYAPPEQFEHGNARVGRHTDIFSLAAVFYELVAGAPAFPFADTDNPIVVMRRILDEARPSFARVVDRLPPELQARPDVVRALDVELARALSPEPGERHPAATELFDAIDKALSPLVSVTSLPRGGGARGVVVARSSAPPSAGRPEPIDAAPTLLGAPTGDAAPPMVRVSSPDLSQSAATETGELSWAVRTPGMGRGSIRAVAIAPDGRGAVGVGPRGITRWNGSEWTPFSGPPAIDAGRVRAAVWSDQGVVLAGEGSLVVTIAPSGAYSTTRFEGMHVVFHCVVVEPNGSMTLAGERTASGGAVGVIAQIAPRPGGTMAPRVLEIPGCGPLRSAIRLDDATLACGDAGALVLLRARGAPKQGRACDPALNALIAFGDGTAAAVGGGGFAFRVWPTLETQLEAIQTTRDLFALARAPDGSTWTAGAGRRVLRRDASGWTRVGIATRGDAAAIVALHAGASNVLAFCDDGAVLEGERRV